MFMPHANGISPALSGVNSSATGTLSGSSRRMFSDANTTAVAHVLVMNNGAAIGTVAPGASLTTTVSGNGGDFRCTNHPSMVGSINGAEPPKPPDNDPDDGYDY